MSSTVHYDREADVAYIRFSEDKVLKSAEVPERVVLAYDADGRVVGMEVLDASRRPSATMLKDAAWIIGSGGLLPDTTFRCEQPTAGCRMEHP